MEWTWAQVSGPNGEVWAIPQDTGPPGMLYRRDIFDQYGNQVPTTWDEFAAAGRKLHAANPNVYLTNCAVRPPCTRPGCGDNARQVPRVGADEWPVGPALRRWDGR
ncbi:extracellular solute-binding protein [Micromonospora lupini]|uniref:extracellular solute-binding protein n=1 Tax=Micromonospora lupini TaxID=285679 RepID=UPI0033C21CCF